MSKAVKLRPLRNTTPGRREGQKSASPIALPKRPQRNAVNLPNSRWRTGGYYSNSGLLNPYYQSSRHTPAGESSARTLSVELRDSAKSFHPNVELRDSAELRCEYPVKSMINRSSVDYDPIFHTARSPCVPTTPLRMKGLNEILDRSRLHTSSPTPQYSSALQANPRAFCRPLGEFTRFNDNCIRSIGEPFAKKP